MKQAPSPLKAAIVGLRNHAGTLEPDKNHGLIKSFKAQPDVEVVAYCEWAADQAAALAAIGAADPQARLCHSMEELLDQVSFDLAVILLPPNEAITAALQLTYAGKHLFIEKNGARRAAEVQPLCDLAAKKGVVIQIGYPWRQHPVAQQIKALLDDGALGRLLAIEARLVTTQVRAGLRDPAHWMYRRDSQGGGILHMEGGHWLSLFHYFTGAQVNSVTALCNRLTDQIEDGLEDVATVALEFDNGVHALLHMGYLLSGAGPRNDLNFSLRGHLGAIHWPLTGEFTVSSATPAWQSAPVRTFHLEPGPVPSMLTSGAMTLSPPFSTPSAPVRAHQSISTTATASSKSSTPPMNRRTRGGVLTWQNKTRRQGDRETRRGETQDRDYRFLLVFLSSCLPVLLSSCLLTPAPEIPARG